MFIKRRKTVVIIIIAIVAMALGGFYYLSLVAGSGFEVYGTLNLTSGGWSIESADTTQPMDDFSLFPKGSNNDGITIISNEEVIIVVQINDKTYEQNLGPYDIVTNNTNNPSYNVFITHIPKGTHEYTVFLYKTTGLILKSRILQDQINGVVTV